MAGLFKQDGSGAGDLPGGGTIMGGGPQSGTLSGGLGGIDLPSDMNLPGGMVPGMPGGGGGAPTGAPVGGGVPAIGGAISPGGFAGVPGGLPVAPGGFGGGGGYRDPTFGLSHILDVIAKSKGAAGGKPKGGGAPGGFNAALPAILAMLQKGAPGAGRGIGAVQ